MTAYDLLRDCYPETTRAGAKDGVSNCEMNKALEKKGFERVRVRQKTKTETTENVVALYRFRNRRWLDPDDPHEASALYDSWCHLNTTFPSTLTFEKCCEHMRHA
eukprot:3001449-Rhodomonas_salina.1